MIDVFWRPVPHGVDRRAARVNPDGHHPTIIDLDPEEAHVVKQHLHHTSMAKERMVPRSKLLESINHSVSHDLPSFDLRVADPPLHKA